MFAIEVKDPKLYCSKCSLSHPWHQLLHKLLMVSPDCVQNIYAGEYNSASTPPPPTPQADIQYDNFWIYDFVYFRNTQFLINMLPKRWKWLLCWSRGWQTVSKLSACCNFWKNHSRPMYFLIKIKSYFVCVIYKLPCMKAVAIFSLISGNAFWKSSFEPIELSNINTVSLGFLW